MAWKLLFLILGWVSITEVDVLSMERVYDMDAAVYGFKFTFELYLDEIMVGSMDWGLA